MAEDIRSVLSKYVGPEVLDRVVDEVTSTEIAPDWFRKQAAELGGAAKERDDLKARLESIESAPKRKEALKRVGIDYDAVPKYGQKALDEIPAEDLDNLEKVAQYVQEQGFDAKVQAEQEGGEKPGSQQVTEFLTNQGAGTPGTETYEEAVANANSQEDLDAVYKRFGKEPAQNPQG